MANRFFENRAYALEKAPVTLYVAVTATATQTGNSPQTLTRAKGITSVTAAATGLWTFTFQDHYWAFLGLDFTWLGSPPAAPEGYIISVAADPAVGTPATLVWQNTNFAGTATAPGTGNIAYFTFSFSNSSSL
jgi:hypothetical protein